MGVQALAASPYLGKSLTKLHLASERIGSSGLEAIAASPAFRGLKDLTILDPVLFQGKANQSAASFQAMRSLVLSPNLTGLTSLTTPHLMIGSASLELLRRRGAEAIERGR